MDPAMNERSLRRLLLEMTCGAEPIDADRFRALAQNDWDAIQTMCIQHRLGPMLHLRCGSIEAIPEEIRAAWRASHRYWACSAMAQRLDLRECVQALAAREMEPIALKGAFLAWHAYPDPALRPLRDLDVLIQAERVDEAFEALQEAGYRPDVSMHDAHAGTSNPAATKHLDPLVTARGTIVELHRQLWESDGVLDHHLPSFDTAAIRSRASPIDGILYPAVEDIFVHLVVHAVYSHRLDCGPLLLWDLYHLVPHLPNDWSSLWSRADREGWERGAALVLALMRRYFGEAVIPAAKGEPAPPPTAMIEVVIDLLLQDLQTRRSAGVAASALSGGRRALGQRFAGGRPRNVADGRTQPRTFGRFAAWFASRARRTASELGRGAVRRQAKGLAELSVWLGT
jgi:hypothetical protein